MIPMDNFNKRLMNLKLSDPFGIIPHPTCQASGHETPVLLQRDGSSVHKAKLKLPKNALPTKHLLEAMRISVCHAQMRKRCCHGCEVLKKKNSTWRWIHLQKTSTWYIFGGGVGGFDMKVLRVFIIIDLKLYPLSSLSLKHCQKCVGLQLNFPPNFYNITWLLQKPLVEKGWMFLHDFSYICNMFLRVFVHGFFPSSRSAWPWVWGKNFLSVQSLSDQKKNPPKKFSLFQPVSARPAEITWSNSVEPTCSQKQAMVTSSVY